MKNALISANIPVEGKYVVVVGRSLVVGASLWLCCFLRRNASVTIIIRI